ncbi:MAG: prepilin-type N-terminal cleavage/methylation domain-containing protein [Betaproteobacteria bacterium]
MRKGFTLVEVMVAMVLTASVALLAYGSLQAGFDTSDRLDTYHRGPESEALMRTMVGDALRHVADAPVGGPSTFRIARGASSDVVTFVTRGVTSPLGAGSLWLMTLSASPKGVEMRAIPMEDSTAAPIETVVESLTAVTARALRPDDSGEWADEWSSARQVPAAVAISFKGPGSRVPPGLFVALSGAVGR